MAFFPQQDIGIPSPTSVNFGGSNTAFDLLNPSRARNAISGLLPGGISSMSKSTPNIGFQSMSGTNGATAAAEDDWRVRVSLSPNAKLFYQDITQGNNTIMHPLIETNGVIWPYTPSITVSHAANYLSTPLTHSNYPAHFYNNSEVQDIQISGDFTVQNMEDGQYLMAAVYFFRSATKMFFGQGSNAGNPPPIVFLDGYGSHYFPHVPCVVTNFTHVLSNDVDYIQVPISQTVLDTSPVDPNRSVNLTPEEQKYVPSLLVSNTQATTPSTQATVRNSRTKSITTSTRVPTISTVTVSLRPMYSRSNLHNRFNLDDFAAGKLVADQQNGFGGFI